MTTPLPQSTRYFRPGITVVYFLPTAADYNAVQRTELDSGTNLSGEVRAIEGFGVTSGVIETPDLVSRFTGQIPGRTTVEESSITFYASQDSQDVRTILPRDTTGFIAIMGGGDNPPDGTMDVYPIRVTATPKQYSLEDEPATIIVQFSTTREPAEDSPIPSAV